MYNDTSATDRITTQSVDNWKTMLKSGHEWTLSAQLGQLKTGQGGKGLLQIHLWRPDELPRLWDRIE